MLGAKLLGTNGPETEDSGYARRRIWFTGENIRPPLHLDKFSRFLSFDQDSFGGRNIYFPLYMLNFNWFSESKFDVRSGAMIRKEDLTRDRVLNRTPSKLASIYLSNNHPYRLEAVKQLSKLGKVDVFGNVGGTKVAQKIDVARDYKYNICFENDLYPGYVTEKLLDAYAIGNVPIYWGDFGRSELFNSGSFLNYADFDSLETLIDVISEIDYESIFSEPLLKTLPDIDNIRMCVRSVILE